MEAITYTDARNNLAKTLDKVNANHAPLLITRQNGTPAVLMSLEDFSAWEETVYLLRSPRNAERLSLAISDIEAKKNLMKRELMES
ncbi:MAG: type II toxin-antitoxin system Phd/YefM family antitoxin [Methylophilaceae bacterium]